MSVAFFVSLVAEARELRLRGLDRVLEVTELGAGAAAVPVVVPVVVVELILLTTNLT